MRIFASGHDQTASKGDALSRPCWFQRKGKGEAVCSFLRASFEGRENQNNLFNFDCWLRRKGQCRNAALAKGFLHCTDCKQHMNQRTVVCCATKNAPTLQRQQFELVTGCRPRGIHLNCEAVTALAIAAWGVLCKDCRALRAVWRLQVPGVGRQCKAKIRLRSVLSRG